MEEKIKILIEQLRSELDSIPGDIEQLENEIESLEIQVKDSNFQKEEISKVIETKKNRLEDLKTKQVENSKKIESAEELIELLGKKKDADEKVENYKNTIGLSEEGLNYDVEQLAEEESNLDNERVKISIEMSDPNRTDREELQKKHKEINNKYMLIKLIHERESLKSRINQIKNELDLENIEINLQNEPTQDEPEKIEEPEKSEPEEHNPDHNVEDPRVAIALDNIANLGKDEKTDVTVPETEHEEVRTGRHFSKAEPSESLDFTYDDEPKARHFSKPEMEKTSEATRAVRTPEMIVNKISREIPEMEERKNQYEEELAKQIENLGEDSKGVEQLKGMIANLENAIETRKLDIERINNSEELKSEDFDELYQKYNIGVFDKITGEAKKDELPAKVNKSKFAEIFEGAKGKIQQVWDKLKSLVKHKDKDNTKSDKSDSTER